MAGTLSTVLASPTAALRGLPTAFALLFFLPACTAVARPVSTALALVEPEYLDYQRDEALEDYSLKFRQFLGRSEASTVNELVAALFLLLALLICLAVVAVIWICGRIMLRRLPREAVLVASSTILVCFVQTYGEGALPSYFPTSPEGRAIGLSASGRILGAFPLATLLVSVGDFHAAGDRSLSAFLGSGGLTTYLIRRLGPRTVVSIGLAIGAIGSFFFGSTPDFLRVTGTASSLLEPLLMVWRLVSGAGTCLAQVAAFVLIDTVEGLAAHRGLAIALTEVGFWGSMLCGSFLGSYAYLAGERLLPAFSSFLPFESAMSVPSLAAVMLQLIALRLVWGWLASHPRTPASPEEAKAEEQECGGSAEVLSTAAAAAVAGSATAPASSVWTADRMIVLFSVFLNALAVGGTFGVLGVELASPPTSLHAGEVGHVFTAMSAARMLASPAVGMLLDRWRSGIHMKPAGIEKEVIAAGWALYAAAFVLLSMATTLRESALLMTNLAMIGVGIAGTVVQTPSRLDLERGVAEKNKGPIVAVWNAAYACGMVVGPTALSAAFGPLGFQRSILCIAGVSAIMCVAMQLFASRERDEEQRSRAPPTAADPPSAEALEADLAKLDRHITAVSWTFYSGQALDFIYIFSIVPVSYDLAQHLGDGLLQPAHATVLSGFLISTTFIGELFGVIGATPLARMPYVQKRIRKVVFGCQLFVFFSWLAFVFFACAPWVLGFRILGPVTRIAVLLACRGIAGIAMAARHVLSRVMVLKWLPPSKQVAFTILDNAIKSLSMGVGPLWASGVTFGLTTLGVATAGNEPLIASMITLSLTPFIAIWLVSYQLFVPVNEPPVNLTATEPPQEEEKRQTKSTSLDRATVIEVGSLAHGESLELAEEEKLEAAKRKLWITAMSVGFERAWVVAGLEVATALILNLEFGVAVVDNGLLIGGTFIASSFFALPTLHAKEKKWLTDTQLLTITQALVVFFTLLLFDGIGDLIGLSRRARLGLLLFADCGLYSVAYTGHGILKGLVFNHPSKREGTLFTPVNHILLNELSAAFARFLSAPTARYLVQAGGRNLYAAVQLGIATFSFTSALMVIPQIVFVKSEPRSRKVD